MPYLIAFLFPAIVIAAVGLAAFSEIIAPLPDRAARINWPAGHKVSK